MRIGLFTDTYFPQVSGVATSIRTLKTELESRGTLFLSLRRQIRMSIVMKIGKLSAFQVFPSLLLRIAALPIEDSARRLKLLNNINWILSILRQNFLLACWGFGLRVNWRFQSSIPITPNTKTTCIILLRGCWFVLVWSSIWSEVPAWRGWGDLSEWDCPWFAIWL